MSRIASSLLLAALVAAAPSLHAQGKQEREAAAPAGALAEVGKGEHATRQAMKPGAYITPRHRKAVQQYLARHHGPGKPCLPGLAKQGAACVAAAGAGTWTLGAPLSKSAQEQPVPAGLAAALPRVPPGTRYVLSGGDILLVGAQSRIVVDAVPHGG